MSEVQLEERYEERIPSLSQSDRVSKSCMNAGFISVVEVGQYFMTEDTEKQFFARACSEYTLPREGCIATKRMDPGKHKNWIRAGSHDQLLAWQTWNRD